MFKKLTGFTFGFVPQTLVVILLTFVSISSHGKTICETKYRNIHPEHSMCKARNYTCKFRQETEENAKELLDLHNQIRKSIKHIIGKDYFEGKNMKNMQWDHELYLIAQRHVLQCTELPDCYQCHQTDRFYVEQNFAVKTFSSINESFNGIIERFKIVVKEWAEELRKYNPDVVNKFHFIGFPTNWTNIFRATTNRVGCASIAYDTQKKDGFTEVYVCNYGPAILSEEEAIYQPAYTNCSNGFCQNQLLDRYGNNISYPANRPPKRKKRSRVWRLSDNEGSSPDLDNCPPKYRNITTDHSYCKPDREGCNFTRNYERYRRRLLHAHNEVRNSVQAYSGWSYGTATNMRVMEWDNDLYEFARRYVIQCYEERDCQLCHQAADFSVEQNFAVRILSDNEPKSGERFERIVKEWATELKDFNESDVKHLPSGIVQRNNKNWINVFRAHTWKIGCASIAFETSISSNKTAKEVYICNYGPAKLSEGEEVYEIGESCSNCDPGFKCDAQYSNLCSREEVKNATSNKETVGTENDIIADDIAEATVSLTTATTTTVAPVTTTSTTVAPMTNTVVPTTMTSIAAAPITAAPTTATTTAVAPVTTTSTTVAPMTTTVVPTTMTSIAAAPITAAPTTTTAAPTTTTAAPIITTATVSPATLNTTTVAPTTIALPPVTVSLIQQSYTNSTENHTTKYAPILITTPETLLTEPKEQIDNGSSIAPTLTTAITLHMETSAQEILDHITTNASTHITTSVSKLPFETSTIFPNTNKPTVLNEGQGKTSKSDVIWNCTLRFFNDDTCKSEQQCYKAWTMSSDGKQPYMEIDIPENRRTGLLFLHQIYIRRPSCFTFSYIKDVLSSWFPLTSTLYGIVVRSESNENSMVEMNGIAPDWNSLAVDIPWVDVFVQVGVAIKTHYGMGDNHIQIKNLLVHHGPCSAL